MKSNNCLLNSASCLKQGPNFKIFENSHSNF